MIAPESINLASLPNVALYERFLVVTKKITYTNQLI